MGLSEIGRVVDGFTDRDVWSWQQESNAVRWNSYRGGIGILRARGVYTQAPRSNQIAQRQCGLISPQIVDDEAPGPGRMFFYLISIDAEQSLGRDSSGQERPNHNPCL